MSTDEFIATLRLLGFRPSVFFSNQYHLDLPDEKDIVVMFWCVGENEMGTIKVMARQFRPYIGERSTYSAETTRCEQALDVVRGLL